MLTPASSRYSASAKSPSTLPAVAARSDQLWCEPAQALAASAWQALQRACST